MSKVDDILERISEMTVNEAADLKDKMKTRFNITYPDNRGMMMQVLDKVIEEKEEKTGKIVLISIIDGQKINCLKLLREMLGFGLKECKDKVDNLPATLIEVANEQKLIEMQEKFAALGKLELQ